MKKEEIIKLVEEEGIKFIKLVFVDSKGVPKNMEITTHRLESALNNEVIIDGSSIEGLAYVESSDYVLAPDLKTFKRFPLEDSEFGKVAIVFCDILNSKTMKPASGCTRTLLKNELKKLKAKGFDEMNVGFEAEFFLLKDGEFLDDGLYVDVLPKLDGGSKVVREMCFELERVGIVPLAFHHERAPSQYEICVKHKDALASSDDLILHYLVVLKVAEKKGLVANFEPKPFGGISGNGCHTNISISKDNKNVFATGDELSETAKHFLAGILEHADALSCVMNSHDNSYKRLIRGYETPVNICWGHNNRSAMVRVPHAREKARRIELRNPDCLMNPYLGLLAILRAGMYGIEHMLKCPSATTKNAWEKDMDIELLPETLEDAKKSFRESELFRDIIL
ncbi:MAG: glutamine synthetase family protein [Firmicutes bacterium]|nr:glutamine synthetase family protein [Bacillota bacterium]MCL2770982.1 glutamine synthetase family protein [Bacillota bacterium]